MNYTHLSHDQRGDIQYYHNVKEMSAREIAAIGVSNSIVSRELKRNSFKKRNSFDYAYSFVYEANIATKKYTDRRSKNNAKATTDIIDIIIENMKKFNSITSIVAKQRKYVKYFPSATTIYERRRLGIIKPSKAYKRAFKLKKSNSKGQSKSHKRDANTKTIHERPLIITERLKYGHWDPDLN